MVTRGDFAGRSALVTGAGTGIGAATAELLADRGAAVALVGLHKDDLRAVANRIESAAGRTLVLTADVTDADAVRAAVDSAVRTFGGLHLAVNNAGIASRHSDVPELPVEAWDDTVRTNLSGMFYCLRAELPAIAASGGGAVVNVSSVFGDRGLPMRAAYTASKHGIRGLTRSAARDWGPRGIRINELQPGVVNTPMTNGQGEPGEVEAMLPTIPARRVGEPSEIAGAIAFLLSDDASYVTGAHLAVDGGFLA